MLIAATFLPASQFAELDGGCDCLGSFKSSVPVRRFIAVALLSLSTGLAWRGRLAAPDGESSAKPAAVHPPS
ncbi:MAG: hypothetical protein EXS13_06515 [Planctomycetes bacterium]|nr:hypothetical protein [Planctomycetota bacterium]